MKGFYKNVICVKNMESDIFECAYFILSEKGRKNLKEVSKTDIIDEANKTVAETPFSTYFGLNYVDDKSEKQQKMTDIKLQYLFYGFFISCIFLLLIKIIFGF